MSATFKKLGVPTDLLKGIEELGLKTPTPIQEQAIPYLINKGFDTVAQAQTGTGKTAAFGLPLLARINPQAKGIQALIVTPTRELAKQVGKDLFRYTKYAKNKTFVEVCCGGDKIQVQTARLQRPTNIVVGTPGRLTELIDTGALRIDTVQYLVLDEADEMLSMGFKKQLHVLIDLCKKRRATWLFSATFPPSIADLVRGAMSPDPKVIKINATKTVNADITHKVAMCEKDEKDDFIFEFLKKQGDLRGLIFCRTKAGAIMLGKKLEDRGHAVDVIQGDLTQLERDKIMRAFKKERSQFLIATDVAARGLDIKGLTFVIHHQLPDQDQYYTHRAGRTGRAGRKGLSLVLLEAREKKRLKRLEEDLNIHFKPF